MPETPLEVAPEEPPPFLGTWRRLYSVILLYLIVIILLFYCFTRAFAL